MATRNFYERDSVAAQLLWSLLNGEPLIAAQAANELFLSDEKDLLFAYLTLGWWLLPPSTTGLQRARFEAFLTNDCFQFLRTLLPITGSVTELPPLTLIHSLPPPSESEHRPPSSWTVWPAGWTVGQAGKLWMALNEALRKANFQRATFLCIPFCSQTSVIVDLFKALGLPTQLCAGYETTVFESLLPRIMAHCFAVLATKAAATSVPALPTLVGGRCFRISQKALTIWGIQTPLLARLRGPPRLVAEPDASAYWKAACHGIKGFDGTKHMLFVDDADADVVEAFYATHFPHDIPEEWTRCEMEKSHFAKPLEQTNSNPWILAFCV